MCGQTFQTGTNCACPLSGFAHLLTCFATDLSQPVDVYSDWVDACDAVAKEAAAGATRPATSNARQPGQQTRKSLAAVGEEEGYEDDGDGFIENDEVDAEAEYAGE